VGTVVDTDDPVEAGAVYAEYCQLSRAGYGRCSYEDVTLMADGEPYKEMLMGGVQYFQCLMASYAESSIPACQITSEYLLEIYKDLSIEEDAMEWVRDSINLLMGCLMETVEKMNKAEMLRAVEAHYEYEESE
jgi:hypothetical protein